MTKNEFLKIFDMLNNKNSKKLALVLIKKAYDEDRFDLMTRYLIYVCINEYDRDAIGCDQPSTKKIIGTWREFCDYADCNQDVREGMLSITKLNNSENNHS